MLSSVGLVNHWRCTGNGALHSLIFSVAEEQPDIQMIGVRSVKHNIT